jgi:ATP-binding cassette, subfamily B, bacterial
LTEYAHPARLAAPASAAASLPAREITDLLRRALPWLHGFGRPIAKVLGLALLLAAAGAAAPLAVMKLVDTLGKVAAAPGQIAPDAGRRRST